MAPLITQVTSAAGTGARAIKELSAAVSVARSSYYRHRQGTTQSPAIPAAELRRREAIQLGNLKSPRLINFG